MKISDKHSDAARANGKKSRGPVTPEGKAASARNALRHGLFAKVVVLPYEDDGPFHELLNSYIVRFRPTDDVEMSMVEEMAAATWRLRRCMSLETAVFADGPEAGPDVDPVAQALDAFRNPANIEDLARLERYQNRLERAFQRTLNNLVKLRKMVPNEPIDPNVCNTGDAPRPRTTPHPAPQSPRRPQIPPAALPESPFTPPEAPVFP